MNRLKFYHLPPRPAPEQSELARLRQHLHAQAKTIAELQDELEEIRAAKERTMKASTVREGSTSEPGRRWRAVVGIILFAATVAGLGILGVGE